MAADKMKLLAERFLLQIQDVYSVDAITGDVLPGNLVRTIPELNNYLGQAMNSYFQSAWANSQGRKDFINKFPELFGRTVSAIPFAMGATTINLSSVLYPYHDIFDILDSVFATGKTIEAWNPVFLSDALAGTDPFYVGSADRPGMIWMNPVLYIFPLTLTATVGVSFTLNYIKLPVSPTTGKYLDVNGTEDMPFSIDHIKAIADIATQLYKVDDYQEVNTGKG